MNFLAHLCLANGDPGLMLGGLFGDFVRGRRALRAYPEPVRQGIVLHRYIDKCTDRSPVIKKLRPLFPREFRRYAGLKELIEINQLPEYSFVYAGQRGTLDYAFTSGALLEHSQAHIWHANAAFPAHMELPKPWLRFSDHDPVVVDILLRQSSTSD